MAHPSCRMMHCQEPASAEAVDQGLLARQAGFPLEDVSNRFASGTRHPGLHTPWPKGFLGSGRVRFVSLRLSIRRADTGLWA